MEKTELIELIKTISGSKLTRFEYEEKDMKIKMEKECEPVVVVNEGAVHTSAVSEKEIPVTDTEGNVVTSPLVGTFYAAPAEGAEPFVKIGDHVEKGQTLAIVEAMKLMNEIESEFDGEVVEVLVENAQVVEYGQPLFKIR